MIHSKPYYSETYKIETILRYNFSPVRLTKVKGSYNNNLRYKYENEIHVSMRLNIQKEGKI